MKIAPEMTIKILPEWWDMFVEAVRTRTLDQYECRSKSWVPVGYWDDALSSISSLYMYPMFYEFRKKTRTVTINGVDLVAPVLAGDVKPNTTKVYILLGLLEDHAGNFASNALVFTSESDRDAMRNALMGGKP